MFDFAPMFGPCIFVDHNLGTERRQARFPRSKRKRIRRKWEKDPRNWRTFHKSVIYQVGNNDFVCDPGSYAKLKEALRVR